MQETQNFTDLQEKTVSSKQVFDGRLLKVYEDTVRMPDGALKTREYINHIGASCVLPITEDNEAVLVRQFRYPFHAELIEVPAGKLDSAREDRAMTARRELLEETGLTADELLYLGSTYTSVAYSNEIISIYMARGLHQQEQKLDDGEFLNVIKLPMPELIEKVMAGELPDPKTQIAVLKAARILGM